VNQYLSTPLEILKIEKETSIDYTYTFKYSGKLVSGQFFQLSIPGVGEAPISVSDFNDNEMMMTIRKVGRLTDEIFNKKVGETIKFRGPYGNGFDTNNFLANEVTVIAGGTGLAPVKNLTKQLMQKKDELLGLNMIFGFKSSKDILFREEISGWKSGHNLTLTIDREEDGWDGDVGLVTTYIKGLGIGSGKKQKFVVVGPPLMMKFTTLELLKNGAKEEDIWVSFERKMSCGIGKCGHCKIDETYVCLEGPVFEYSVAKNLLD